MRFTITHKTTYLYSAGVALGPQVLRFRPRCGAFQQLHSFRTRVSPAPSVLTEYLDFEGNSVSELAFSQATSSLEILVSMEGKPMTRCGVIVSLSGQGEPCQ